MYDCKDNDVPSDDYADEGWTDNEDLYNNGELYNDGGQIAIYDYKGQIDNGDQYTVYNNDNPNDGLDDNNNTINKSDDKRLDNKHNYGDNNDSYDECYDDGYNNNSCDGNGNDNNFDNDKAENFEDEILFFWATFSADIWDLTTRINSLSTTIICDSHRPDHLSRVPTPLQPFTITIVGSTSSGGYTTTFFIYTLYLVSNYLHQK
jgi:hypothetical protein